MEYDNLVLKKLHKYELDILKYFIDICEKYEINYFAVYGTALGAIRHQGFIPWDDDIDVGMLREDFERFVEAIKKEGNNRYELLNAEENEEFPILFAKLQLRNTKFIQTSYKPRYNAGIFMDIYIFDEVSRVEKERNNQMKRMRFWCSLFFIQRVPKPDLHYKKLRKYAVTFAHISIHWLMKLFLKRDYCYRKYKEAALRYKGKNTGIVSDLFSPTSDWLYLYKSDIFPTHIVAFEDIYIKMPAKSEKMLKEWYGDFMKLPPLEERRNHFPTVLKFSDEDEIRFK